jgi:hypothetical protein
MPTLTHTEREFGGSFTYHAESLMAGASSSIVPDGLSG